MKLNYELIITFGGIILNIKMIGIDHCKANVEQREKFSFTKKASCKTMQNILNIEGITGCIIISTCNRMELYISYINEDKFDLYNIICNEKDIHNLSYNKLFTERKGIEAIKHLFETASGLCSKILGEDQIITQIKDALNLSRECKCTDNVLEVLFRTAITASKKVKTNINLKKDNYSVVDNVIEQLKRRNINLKKCNCLVIGNGEMGRLTAQGFLNQEANVTVTLRQYRSGEVNIPIGCNIINYSERFEEIEQYDIIASATSSPNYTIKYEDIKNKNIKDNLIFIDLAVPRDIEPEVISLNNVLLYDIDSFWTEFEDEKYKLNIKKSKDILNKYIDEFEKWYNSRDLITTVGDISRSAAMDINWRINKYMKELNINDEDKKILNDAIDTAANKVICKIMYEMRDILNSDTWRECVKGIEKKYLNN